MKLRPKHRAFCELYFYKNMSATMAYQKIFKCKPNSARSLAASLLKQPEVINYIETLQEEVRSRSHILKEKIICEFEKIAFSSISNLHKTWILREEFESLPEEVKASISEIETKTYKKIRKEINPETHKMEVAPYDVEMVRVKLHDKIKGLEMLCKLHGFMAPEKSELSIDFDKMTEEQADKFIERIISKNHE